MLYTEMVIIRGGLKPVGIKGARSLKERSPYAQTVEPKNPNIIDQRYSQRYAIRYRWKAGAVYGMPRTPY
jgi:hypothetical protein